MTLFSILISLIIIGSQVQMKIEKVTRRAQEQFQMVLEEQSRL